jgi:hypothetical protein
MEKKNLKRMKKEKKIGNRKRSGDESGKCKMGSVKLAVLEIVFGGKNGGRNKKRVKRRTMIVLENNKFFFFN